MFKGKFFHVFSDVLRQIAAARNLCEGMLQLENIAGSVDYNFGSNVNGTAYNTNP